MTQKRRASLFYCQKGMQVKRTLFEFEQISQHLNFLAAHALEETQVHGDDWDLICDAAIDAGKIIEGCLEKLRPEKEIT